MSETMPDKTVLKPMTPAEVDAVLELWQCSNDYKPKRLQRYVCPFGNGGHWELFPPVGEPLDDAEASDLICGHLRRWLGSRCGPIEMYECSKEFCGSMFVPFAIKVIKRTDDSAVVITGDTLLLTLISAVRAVAGVEKK